MSIHRVEQDAARAAKKVRRLEQEDKLRKSLRAVVRIEIDRADFLRLLKQEGYAPENVTEIISSGHYPDRFVFTCAA